MSVISRVDDKVENVLSLLPDSYSDEDFLYKFKELYPNDYQKCWARYLKEERNTKPGKRHPMQHPDHHIMAALRSYQSRIKKIHH